MCSKRMVTLWFLWVGVVFGGAMEQSFTPTEVDVWIDRIVLSTDMTQSGEPAGEYMTLYQCDQPEDCFIRVTDSNALSVFSTSQSAKAGQYRYMMVDTCSQDNQSFQAKLKGSVLLDGTSYYTHESEGLLEQTGSISPQMVTVSFARCEYYYELQSDVDVTDSVILPVTVWMDFKDLAWARKGATLIEDGCFEGGLGSDATIFTVCMGMPHFIPIQSSSIPTVERYWVYKKGQDVPSAGGKLTVFKGEDGDILGGFSSRYYSETSVIPEISEFDMAIKRSSKNHDGSYRFQTYGNSFESTYLYFPAFFLNDHSGEYSSVEGGELYEYQVSLD